VSDCTSVYRITSTTSNCGMAGRNTTHDCMFVHDINVDIADFKAGGNVSVYFSSKDGNLEYGDDGHFLPY